MCAVNDETAGRDRLQSGETRGDPVALGDGLECQRLARGCAGDGVHQIPDLGLLRCSLKMNLDVPAAIVLLERRDGSAEPVGERIRQQPGRVGVGCDAGEMTPAHPCHSGGAIGVQKRASLRSCAITLAAL